jgi:lipopolysaccharide transport system ATP-binding protein
MSSDEIVIDARGISKRYEVYSTPRDRLKQLVLPRVHQAVNQVGVAARMSRLQPAPQYFREFWALRDIAFQVARGETLGIIGRNGSGKSTLLQILAGTLSPTLGEIDVRGRVAALLELGSGFNPEFSGRENVFLNGRILGLTQKEIEDKYDDIVAFADIGDFIDQPVKTYSSGMFVRLAFAVQAHIDASIIIIDEALAVGDVFFRTKCYTRLERLRESGTAILLVSHSMPDIEQYCERAILLDHGKQLFTGASAQAAKRYYLLHQEGPEAKSAHCLDGSQGSIEHAGPIATVSREEDERIAYLEVEGTTQISDGSAKCTGVALYNDSGTPCHSFRQGDTAVFYCRFELLRDMDVPICGIVIKNERGVIVHGKNTWQFDHDVPQRVPAGSQLTSRYEVKLDIGLGEYVFEAGLASVPLQVWRDRKHMSHDMMSSQTLRHCHVPDVGSFAVGLAIRDGVAVLTHHGVSNLIGDMTISAGARPHQGMESASVGPTVSE